MKRWTELAPLNAILLPDSVPEGWALIDQRDDGVSFARGGGLELLLPSPSTRAHGRMERVIDLGVIISGCTLGQMFWVHAVVCRKDRRPTFDEVDLVKDTFFGPEAQMMASVWSSDDRARLGQERYQSVHLWGCADCAPLPRELAQGIVVGGFDFSRSDLLSKLKVQ